MHPSIHLKYENNPYCYVVMAGMEFQVDLLYINNSTLFTIAPLTDCKFLLSVIVVTKTTTANTLKNNKLKEKFKKRLVLTLFLKKSEIVC